MKVSPGGATPTSASVLPDYLPREMLAHQIALSNQFSSNAFKDDVALTGRMHGRHFFQMPPSSSNA
jgi:hypothetical protein